MGSSAPKTQTITERTNSEPWSGAQPALTQALAGAQQQFAAGMPAFYPGQTVAPMSGDTLSGLNAIRSNAGASSSLANQQLGAINGVMNRGPTAGTFNLTQTARGQNGNPWAGYFGAQSGVSNPFLGAIGAAGSQSVNTSQLNPFISGGAANPMAGRFEAAAAAPVTGDGMHALGQAARGEMLSNPFLDATFNKGAEQIRNQVDTAFARAGRSLNNTNYADTFARSLGDFATDLYGGAYENDMTRRMGAASQLAGYEQGGADRMLSALGSEASLGEAGLGRWYDAASQVTGYGDSAINRLLQSSGMSADVFANNRAQNLSAGQFGAGLYDQDLSRSIDAYLALAGQGNAQAGLALQGAGMLPGVYDFAGQGARDMLGVGSSLEAYQQALIDADRERYNYDANAGRANVEWLNAIASGMGALGGTSVSSGQRPYQSSNPFLQGLGALSSIASIASVFGMSDRAAKRDAAFIGRDDAGNRIWRFRYAWDDPGAVRFGVMADEVDAAAVARHPSGFAVVDYAKVFA